MLKREFVLKDIQNIAKEVVSLIYSKENSKATIVALSGDLGAGKTHITKAVAKELGIKNKIVSPTFVLMKKYKIKKKDKFSNLIHIDAYRLEKENEIEQLGYLEITKDKNNLIFIEWPERISSYLPKNRIKIELLHIDEEKRGIKIK